jgi:Transposase and inactivated derivatives
MNTISKDALIVASRQELIDIIIQQASVIEKHQCQIQELQFQLDWFKRQVFGSKSEQFIPDDDLQEALDLGVIKNDETKNDTAPTKITYEKKPVSSDIKPLTGHGRGPMPTHLPITDVVIEPEGDLSGMVRIGEEVSWYFDMDKPASLRIIRTIRPKYVTPKKDDVTVAKLPALPIEKGNAGPGLLTQILIDKYEYHIPLDRQRKIFKNEYDVEFSESWLCDNVKNSVFWLEPVFNEYAEIILSSDYLQADETTIPVLTKDHKGKTHRGYYWVYNDPIRHIAIFDYRKSRSREGPNEFLKNFNGTLQIDGYEGYQEIIIKNALKRGGCLDHVRRRFEKALAYDNERATFALDSMRVWYMLERQARESGLSFNDKLAMRREKIAPSMGCFKQWMLEQVSQVLPKSPMGIALSYALNQWTFFDPYLNDGRIELSNILIENAIRPVAIGRKNYMFAGSHEAARRAAIVYSLTSTAKWHGCDPFVYIKELLTELPRSKSCNIGKFLLPQWKPSC